MAVAIRLFFTLFCAFLLSSIAVTALPTPAGAQIFAETPDVGLRIRPPEGGCARGRRCQFSVIVGNRGDASFQAPLFIRHETSPRRISPVNAGSPDWQCSPAGGLLSCARQGRSLQPGQRTRYSLSIFVPRDVLRRRIRVCAAIDWRRPGALIERTRTVQRILLSEGYRLGQPDGEVGPATRRAIAQYQADEGLRVSGRIDRELIEELTEEWGVGDARGRNDRTCVQTRLYNGGTFEPEPVPEPNVLPAPDQSNRSTQSEPSGRRLRCPATRVQDGRTCVCRPGLVEDETGACVSGRESVAAPEPEPRTDQTQPDPVRDACTTGRRRSSSGECVCLPGRVERDGQCVVKSRQQAACSGGKERNANGRCVCPRGLQDRDGICQLPEDTTPAPRPKKKVIKKKEREPKQSRPKSPELTKKPLKKSATPESSDGNACTNNKILNENGKCQCYLNLQNSDGKCLVKVRAKCLPGEVINVRGKCECPKNREIRDGKCILRQ